MKRKVRVKSYVREGYKVSGPITVSAHQREIDVKKASSGSAKKPMMDLSRKDNSRPILVEEGKDRIVYIQSIGFENVYYKDKSGQDYYAKPSYIPGTQKNRDYSKSNNGMGLPVNEKFITEAKWQKDSEMLKFLQIAQNKPKENKNPNKKEDELIEIVNRIAKKFNLPTRNIPSFVKVPSIIISDNSRVTISQNKPLTNSGKGVFGGSTFEYKDSFKIEDSNSIVKDKIRFQDLENQFLNYVEMKINENEIIQKAFEEIDRVLKREDNVLKITAQVFRNQKEQRVRISNAPKEIPIESKEGGVPTDEQLDQIIDSIDDALSNNENIEDEKVDEILNNIADKLEQASQNQGQGQSNNPNNQGGNN